MRAFAVVLFGEIFGRFGADLFIIVIPRARPLGAPLPIMVARIDSDAVARPCAETRLDPVERTLRAIGGHRSEEHTSELQSLMRISYAVFCLKKKKQTHTNKQQKTQNTSEKQKSTEHK